MFNPFINALQQSTGAA